MFYGGIDLGTGVTVSKDETAKQASSAHVPTS